METKHLMDGFPEVVYKRGKRERERTFSMM